MIALRVITMDPHTETPRAEVLDHALLAQLVADLGDVDVVRNLIGTYLGELEERHRAIIEAVESRNTNDVAFAAHALVSPSRTLGVVGVAGPARAIEVMAKNGKLDGVDAELTRLAEVVPRAVIALKDW